MVHDFFSAPRIREFISLSLLSLLKNEFPNLGRLVRLAPKEDQLLVWYVPSRTTVVKDKELLKTTIKRNRSAPTGDNRRPF
jgi:hypothetical protein